MSLIEYHLYRVKFIKPSQLPLFAENLSPSEIFRRALEEKPSMELRRDNTWHIGNIQTINHDGGKFAVGRTTKTTVEKFDELSGDFLEEMDDSGPYTYVYFDQTIGLLGIAKKSKVAPDVISISKKIKGLLEATNITVEIGVEVVLAPIPDPETFIEKIRSAYAIKKFKAYFTGPNPVDADALFQRPLAVYCKDVNGKFGSVEVVGDSLNEEVVEAVTKSTAATANTVSARIQQAPGKKSIPISLKGDAVKISVDPLTSDIDVLKEMQNKYNEIRYDH